MSDLQGKSGELAAEEVEVDEYGVGIPYPQIPVLFMAMLTSPGSSLPDCTSSRLGSASATQRSCSGFVKTPMLDFVGWVSVVVVVEDDMLTLCVWEWRSVGGDSALPRNPHRYNIFLATPPILGDELKLLANAPNQVKRVCVE